MFCVLLCCVIVLFSVYSGMLPDATLPPGTDHTYAQWLERVELPRSPQPSPYKKRLAATPVKKYLPTGTY